jgi:hypothetical protein
MNLYCIRKTNLKCLFLLKHEIVIQTSVKERWISKSNLLLDPIISCCIDHELILHKENEFKMLFFAQA